jgi:hypothetical protein
MAWSSYMENISSNHIGLLDRPITLWAIRLELSRETFCFFTKTNRKIIRTMQSTEHLPASRLMLRLVPRPAWIAPRVAIDDRGRSLNK